MNRLRNRVKAQGGAHKAAAAGFRPSRVTAPGGVSGGAASPSAPGTMPLAEVLVFPEPGGTYATVAYRGLSPVFTPDGAAIPASAPGRWAQLRMAGRP